MAGKAATNSQPSLPQRIYNALVRNLRYPDGSDAGTLLPLIDGSLDNPTIYGSLMEKLNGTIFSSALHNYSLLRATPGEELNLFLDWISGEKVFITAVRNALPVKSKEFPISALSMMTTLADQYYYLLSGWSWIAAQAGYAGLAVLLDESEHYSLLNVRGQERADNFFKGLMYTSLSARPDCKINEAQLAHHHSKAHPFRFADRSHLLVMFAVTPSASTFDYRRWLNEDQIIALSAHLSAGAVKELMVRLQSLHQQAYNGGERSGDTSEISRSLLECLDGKLINLRQMIRLAMEIYDINYAYPDFSSDQAVAELRRAMLGR